MGFDIESPVTETTGTSIAVSLCRVPAGLNYFDSLAVEADGTVAVATIANGGISRISPKTDRLRMCRLMTDDNQYLFWR